jgi:hypothetical protein
MRSSKRNSTFFSKFKKSLNKLLHILNRINLQYLCREQSVQISCLIASLIAGIYILYLFPLGFLAGKGALFERLAPLISLSGWWSFKADSWHFPLLHTQLLNAPEGANIAVTHSIPLLALVFKPFNAWLAPEFHYFGIWFALSYLLQSISAVLLARARRAYHFSCLSC